MRRNISLALFLVAILFALLPVAARRVNPTRAAVAATIGGNLPQKRKANASQSRGATVVREIDLEGLKRLLQRDGQKGRPLLVNFWATWCDPCREEFPDLVQIDRDYKARGLEFVTVSLDDPADIKTSVPQFLRQMRSTMPAYLLNVPDPEPAIKWVDEAWGGGLPATYLYDAQGQVVFKHMGRIKPAELRSAINTVTSDK
jgi:thiol-disulfide isomerase/thioredoxin